MILNLFKYNFWLFLLAFTCFGFTSIMCGVDPAVYLEEYQLQSGEFKKEVSDNSVIYTVSYIPKEIQVIQAVRNKSVTNSEAQQWLNNKDNEVSFIFQIEIPSIGKQEFLKMESDSIPYEQRLKYFSFNFKNDMSLLVNGSEKIAFNNFHFERDFGMSPKGTFTVSAILPKSTKRIEFVFHDKIYGSKEHSIEFDFKKMKSLPQLKTINKWKN